MSTPTQLNVCQTTCMTVTVKNSCCELVPIKEIKVESSNNEIVQITSISSPNFTITGVSPGTTQICVYAFVSAGQVDYCLPVTVIPDDPKNFTIQLQKVPCTTLKCTTPV